ncbi:RcnB family protein [Acerihabitans sp. TG2]|uniref:RcnB family protein n=1 Tax=Acerihabitans sp. TG2 TaxID=3096008 RepID=UPI002B23376C|nr:RcnB family protein [Acerihabitans sp. TG2]MEA9391247.1 RcnB family protein [Acerihabitans sp. TG2]
MTDTMGKSKAGLVVAMLFLGALPFASSSYAETVPSPAEPIQPTAPTDAQNPPLTPSPNAPTVQSPDLQSFYLDSKQYQLGDIVPDLYRTKPYEIIDWKTRHLPAPDDNSHWTYMAGNYVLIANLDGKIVKVESGKIFSPM